MKKCKVYLLIILLLFTIIPNVRLVTHAEDISPYRVFFIGDSRTVDMFSGKKSKIENKSFGNMIVYAKDGATISYLKYVVKTEGISSDDTIITWMGANDRGNFKPYSKYYNKLIKKGLRVILCTIGCSDNNKLHDEGDRLYYNDGIMKSFNKKLIKYANKNELDVIDLYKYTKKHIKVQPDNGVHYLPKPNKKLQNHILYKVENLIGGTI